MHQTFKEIKHMMISRVLWKNLKRWYFVHRCTIFNPVLVTYLLVNVMKYGTPLQGEFEAENSTEVRSQTEVEEPQEESLDPSDMESKEQQYAPRRNYPNNQRGGRGAGGGRRGYYPNGRGARGSSRGGGPYQNGRNQFFDHPGNHPGNYYPRNYYSNRGRGGRGGGGGNFYNNHTSGAQATNPPAES